jgi:hypothetical protein
MLNWWGKCNTWGRANHERIANRELGGARMPNPIFESETAQNYRGTTHYIHPSRTHDFSGIIHADYCGSSGEIVLENAPTNPDFEGQVGISDQICAYFKVLNPLP